MADPTAAATVQPPNASDIAIPPPPPRDENDFDLFVRYLWQNAKSGQFNATLNRQARAALLALYGKSLDATEIATANADATVIANPPTQANVTALQASLNAAIVQLDLAILQVNALSAILSALVLAVNADLKSLPATAAPSGA